MRVSDVFQRELGTGHGTLRAGEGLEESEDPGVLTDPRGLERGSMGWVEMPGWSGPASIWFSATCAFQDLVRAGSANVRGALLPAGS